MLEVIDPSVRYEGPRASFATITGSPMWGLGDGFAAFAAARGFQLVDAYRLATPYGLGPRLEHYTSPTGRPVLRIPSYGMVRGEDWSLRSAEWKTFWLLWQAGVQVLIVGGTSGTCDWRDGDDAVLPGDLVLPWSYFSLDSPPTGLPGTELESVLAERVPLMDEPFCPSLAGELRQEVARLAATRFRKVHGQEARVILNRWQYGAFESAGHSLFLRQYGRSVGSPVITGDCVSPVLARVCGMHMLYYHIASNWAEDLRPQHLTHTLDKLYLETLPSVIAELELSLLERVAPPADCRCGELLRPRPPAYARALSPRCDKEAR